jgi:hypothetical protein
LLAVPEPEGSEVSDLVLAGDQHNCSGKLAAINIALECLRHPLQAISIKSKRSGIALGLQLLSKSGGRNDCSHQCDHNLSMKFHDVSPLSNA